MSDEPKSLDTEQALDVLSRIGDVLIVLSDVGAGDYEIRCPTDLPETHALGALFAGVNEMVESLQREKERAAAYRREIEDKLATIERQQDAIRELSTPIIEVWEGVLCLVVVGSVDDARGQEMVWALLHAINEKKARHTIIDITGLGSIDTATAQRFLELARAVRMLGTMCVITGIAPAIAPTLVALNVEMVGIVTHRTMRDALREILLTYSIRR